MSTMVLRKSVGKALDLVGLKRFVLLFQHLTRMAAGAVVFLFTGRTPAYAYQSMVGLFCETGGRSNDLLSALLSIVRPRYQLAETRGVLGEMSGSNLSSVIADLDEKGYHVFETRLPDELCDRLLELGLRGRSTVRPFSVEEGKLSQPVEAIYDRSRPMGVRYDFSAQDLAAHPEIQGLLADPSLVAVSQAYLRSAPVLDLVTMWWHTGFLKTPDKEAAQYYHFDMDRLKWLKFFFYITDVNTDSGPHCFVEGSQRTGGIPRPLLRKGYARLEDAEVQAEYPREKFIEFTAARGTIIAEDTRGLHKGKHVAVGDRLVFQLEYSNSLFGGTYSKIRLNDASHPQLREMMSQYPRIYSIFNKAWRPKLPKGKAQLER